MRLRYLVVGIVACVLGGLVEAATLRVIAVEVADPGAYLRGVEQGRALLKAKGSPATIRVWRGRFAGRDTGSIIVSVEYPNLEALAKDDAKMQSDPELQSWLRSLDDVRTVLSDSIYNELIPVP